MANSCSKILGLVQRSGPRWTLIAHRQSGLGEYWDFENGAIVLRVLLDRGDCELMFRPASESDYQYVWILLQFIHRELVRLLVDDSPEALFELLVSSIEMAQSVCQHGYAKSGLSEFAVEIVEKREALLSRTSE